MCKMFLPEYSPVTSAFISLNVPANTSSSSIFFFYMQWFPTRCSCSLNVGSRGVGTTFPVCNSPQCSETSHPIEECSPICLDAYKISFYESILELMLCSLSYYFRKKEHFFFLFQTSIAVHVFYFPQESP